MWTGDPDAEKLVTLSYHLADPDVRRRSWLMRRDLQAAAVRPKSATVYSGQALDAGVLDAAAAAAADCDVLIAVGTSLSVHPAAGLVEVAAAHGARIVVVNAEPTPYDPLADLVVRTPISAALPRLLGA
ncbi:hypothetical protein [Modestobacter sp. URMC 112]